MIATLRCAEAVYVALRAMSATLWLVGPAPQFCKAAYVRTQGDRLIA